MKIIGSVLWALVFFLPVLSQTPEHFAVFDSKGNSSSIAAIIKALEGVDVVFLGEQHDDSFGHAVEFEIFTQAVEQYAAKRKIALSMEMFERDVQIVVDEYLKGQITEAQFLASSRPWPNYKTGYRPLVEMAKDKKLRVIAANAPRRYVNMVSRGGRDTLNGLSKEAKPWIAPLPYGQPSDAYAKKFKALMGPSPEAQMGIDNILASQSLWDATMGNSVANYLKKDKGALVVHLNGGFHTESHLGTVEHLMKYRPKTKAMVVTIHYADDFKTFDKTKDTDIGDFVILTEPKTKAQSVIPEILHRMELHNKSLQTLRSDLTMVKYDSQLNMVDTSAGKSWYLPKAGTRSPYLRVDWETPLEEKFMMIGDSVEFYRPRLDRVLVGKISGGPLDSMVCGALVFLNMSIDQLRSNYEITYVGEELISGNTKTWHLVVSPKVPANFKSADVWIDVDGMPRQARINESKGDTITVLLSNIQKNVAIDAKTFKLEYPRTAKVIRF